MDNAEAILSGGFSRTLTGVITLNPQLDRIRETCKQRCYNARDVLKMEATGVEAIQGLLGFLVGALDRPQAAVSKRLRHLLAFIYEPSLESYEHLLRITDHVAGMTDNYAVRLYRELRGMRYPGGRD